MNTPLGCEKMRRGANLEKGFYLILYMNFYNFLSFTEIVEGFFMDDKLCIVYLRYIKFL